ncbi:MAG: fatty acid desaturase [Bdellovibrionaceae bacterium]|nr:fatty acid desaturase [Pseudobdellovibrionaceae bacterium]
MDKKKYLEFRKQINFKFKHKVLFQHLLLDTGLMTLNYFLLTSFKESPWVYLSIPIFASLMFRNFSLMHEAVHGLVSKNKLINDGVGIIAGGLCLLPYEPWKQVHLEHHYWSGNIEKDPVMALARTFPDWNKKIKISLGFLWKAWIPVLALLQYAVFWILSSVKFLKNPRCLRFLTSMALPIMGIIGLCYAMGSNQVLTILLPSVFLYLLAVEVVNFPHHVGLPYFDDENHIPVWDQHITARSCVYPTWISKLIVLNFNYHIEHHMFPDAPWYYLSDLHKLISAELKDQYNTDPQFVWIKENRVKSLSELFKSEQRIKDQQKRSA